MLKYSMVSLLQLMSYDGMEYIIRTSMLGCNHFGYQSHIEEFNERCKPSYTGVGWIAPWFCVIFCVVCSVILMSALIGLIISSMESLMEIKTAEIEIWKDVAEVAEAYEIQYHTVMWMLELFDLLDEEGHCHLTFLELQEMFEEAGVAEESDQFAMFLNVDRDGSGQIEFPEFCELVSIAGILVEKGPVSEQKKHEAAERLKKQDEKLSVSIGVKKKRTNSDSIGNATIIGRLSTSVSRDVDDSGFDDVPLPALMKIRMSSKNAFDRKVNRNISAKHRQKTRDELYEHILGGGSGSSKHAQKFGRAGSASREVSLSASNNFSIGSMARPFDNNDSFCADGVYANALMSFKASKDSSSAEGSASGPPRVKTKDLVASRQPLFSPIEENKASKPAPVNRLPSWKTGKCVLPSPDSSGSSGNIALVDRNGKEGNKKGFFKDDDTNSSPSEPVDSPGKYSPENKMQIVEEIPTDEVEERVRTQSSGKIILAPIVSKKTTTNVDGESLDATVTCSDKMESMAQTK